MRRSVRAITIAAAGGGLFAAMAFGVTGAIASGATAHPQWQGGGRTATPIKHLVVIFDENVSFDHYFGTYPYAQNNGGEYGFTAKRGTPQVNGLYNDTTSVHAGRAAAPAGRAAAQQQSQWRDRQSGPAWPQPATDL